MVVTMVENVVSAMVDGMVVTSVACWLVIGPADISLAFGIDDVTIASVADVSLLLS